MSVVKLLIVGNPEPFHVGAHLLDAASHLSDQLHVQIIDVREASRGPKLLGYLFWKLAGRRQLGMWSFNKKVRSVCTTLRPHYLIVTGIAPLTADTVQYIRQTGVICANWLTDDPWNPTHKSLWFLKALSDGQLKTE